MWLTDLEKLTDPKYGLRVRFVSGWKRRGSSGGAQMKTASSVLWHHTAGSRKGNNPSRNILINGRAGLSGPLCHINFPRDGTVEVVAAGKANHAGKGIVKGVPRNGGNTRMIGIEMESAGTRPWDWTAEQLAAMPLLGAALSDIFGLSTSDHYSHQEYSSTGKIDPAGLPGGMAGLRSRIGSVRFNTGGGTGRPPLSAPTNSGLADVDKAQAWLDGLGYNAGPIDGKFGSKTEAATLAFQTDWGLTADGLPGPATRQALEAAVSKIDDIHDRVTRYLDTKTSHVARQVWEHPVTLKGSEFEGKTSAPGTKVAWLDHERESGEAAIRKDVAALGAGLIALDQKVDALVKALTESKGA